MPRRLRWSCVRRAEGCGVVCAVVDCAAVCEADLCGVVCAVVDCAAVCEADVGGVVCAVDDCRAMSSNASSASGPMLRFAGKFSYSQHRMVRRMVRVSHALKRHPSLCGAARALRVDATHQNFWERHRPSESHSHSSVPESGGYAGRVPDAERKSGVATGRGITYAGK